MGQPGFWGLPLIQRQAAAPRILKRERGIMNAHNLQGAFDHQLSIRYRRVAVTVALADFFSGAMDKKEFAIDLIAEAVAMLTVEHR